MINTMIIKAKGKYLTMVSFKETSIFHNFGGGGGLRKLIKAGSKNKQHLLGRRHIMRICNWHLRFLVGEQKASRPQCGEEYGSDGVCCGGSCQDAK